MADLRSIAATLGFADASTYLQSGNLVLRNAPLDTAEVAAALTAEIRTSFDLEVAVIIRTAGEWTRVVAANPFPADAADGAKLHVVFLDGPATDSVRSFEAARYEPEALAVTDSEVYLSLPNGMGRSKLAAALARIPNADTGTTRNWKTVLAVSEILDRS